MSGVRWEHWSVTGKARVDRTPPPTTPTRRSCHPHSPRRGPAPHSPEKGASKPFGPVDNGSQSLYGLDYKTAMWRGSEENPFHTEGGYWPWDAAAGEGLRGFLVAPRTTTSAGG